MRRISGLVAGVGTHGLFAFTVWHLFWFLKGGQTNAGIGSMWVDVILSISFGVVHSGLLYPTVRETLSRWIAAPFYGLFYCAVTCGCLLGMFASWTTSPAIWWEFTGLARSLVNAGWYASWAGLIYGLWLGGLGYQTGATPWWNWVRGRPQPPRPFHPRGAFRFMRHPAYLGFLGLVWFTPVMTADRAVLTASWTIYVFVGSWLKDERLAHYIGEPYRIYQSRVPGYLGLFIGPLARLPFAATAQSERAIAMRVSAKAIVTDPVVRRRLVSVDSTNGKAQCSHSR